jgi:hypothetical protein
MNRYKCQFPANTFLEVYPEEENTTVALKVRTGPPADKAVSLIELSAEDAKYMAEYILIDILYYHIVNPEMVQESDPELYQKLKAVVEEHIND